MSAAPMVAPPPSTSGVSLTSSGAPGPGGSTLLPATSSVGSTGSSINGNIPPAAAHAGVTSTSGTNGDNATATLSRKVRKVLQLRPDQCREELKKMSSFVTQNTAHTRRNLRTTIEQQSLKVHSTFVEEVGTKIESLLEELEGEIDSLSDLADRVHSDLQNSRKRTYRLNEEASSLREKRDVCAEKKKICEAFLNKFRLSEEEMDRVRNGDNTINDAFFEVLDKVMEIRRNCQLRTNNFTGGVSGAGASALKLQAEMMQQASTRDAGASSAISSAGGQTHHMGGHALLLNTSSAFDVLQETSDILDIAYERLFISVQQHCRRGFSAATASGVSGINFGGSQGAHLMKRSLQYLKERPVYFNHCLRDIAKMRKQMLNTRFHEALSRGGEDSHAIEMCKQYDPVRYVGDILAWIHENIATEREALTTFLGISAAGKERKKALRQQVGSLVASTKGGSTILDVASRAEVLSSIVNYEDAVSNDDGLLADLFSLLDFVLEGVCDSFKSRMDSLLHLDSLVGCYKISRLLAYFSRALTFLLNKDARLLQLINLYQQKMAQRFLDVCDANSQTMRGTTSNANTSSGGGQDDPTGQGSAAHGSRFAIMDDLSCPLFVREAVKMMHEIVQDVDSLEEFQPILCAAYDPLLNHCRQMFSSNPEDRAVFLINCISLMLEPLKTLPLAQDRAVLYSQLIQEQQMYLIEHQGQETLQKLGLLEKVTALRDVVGYPEKFPDGGFPTAAQLQQVPELHAVSLSSVLRSFYTSLFTLKALSVPHVEKISARELREETRKAVGRKILEAYIFLHDGLQALQVTTHTKDQVAMLLLGA